QGGCQGLDVLVPDLPAEQLPPNDQGRGLLNDVRLADRGHDSLTSSVEGTPRASTESSCSTLLSASSSCFCESLAKRTPSSKRASDSSRLSSPASSSTTIEESREIACSKGRPWVSTSPGPAGRGSDLVAGVALVFAMGPQGGWTGPRSQAQGGCAQEQMGKL